MIRALIITVTALCVFYVNCYAAASASIPVSPGGGTEESVVGTGCPTFSWSSAEGAAGYRLEFFRFLDEILDHDDSLERGELVLKVDIAAPALAWSPSGNEYLKSGESYVWYVKAFDSNGEGAWGAPAAGSEWMPPRPSPEWRKQ